MKNIKTIDQFLLEALRDTWRENAKNLDTNIGDKYFGLVYDGTWKNKIIDDLVQFFTVDYDYGGFVEGHASDFYEEEKENYYDDDLDEDIEPEEFWKIEDVIIGFEDYIRDIIYDTLSDLIGTIHSNYKKGGGLLDIYREIDVNQVWLDLFLNKENDEVHLGEYWAYDESGVDTYWGNGRDHKVKFHAKVPQTDINWFTTFEQNVTDPEECEINLYPNTPIELLSITIDGKEVDLSNFKNKEIYA